MTIRDEHFTDLQAALSTIYSGKEAESIAFLVFEHLGIDKTEVLAGKKIILNESGKQFLSSTKARLFTNEPIQYILGKTVFYGLKFDVNKEVLIPRQETEELVNLIIRENTLEKPSILDIGTGSGCIAISLKKNIPDADVSACDIRRKAINLAKKNARLNGIEIQFHQKDVLRIASLYGKKYDIIVSNPPYITKKEKILMDSNVVDFEPAEALFVPENNPLVFYECIIELAARNLTDNGSVYFEINESRGAEVEMLLNKARFKAVRIIKDINGKDRFATGNI